MDKMAAKVNATTIMVATIAGQCVFICFIIFLLFFTANAPLKGLAEISFFYHKSNLHFHSVLLLLVVNNYHGVLSLPKAGTMSDP
jgi:hypothetical protein